MQRRRWNLKDNDGDDSDDVEKGHRGRDGDDDSNSNSSSSSEVEIQDEEDGSDEDDDDDENPANTSTTRRNRGLAGGGQRPPPRAWIYDRVRGNVKQPDAVLARRPPCFMCYPPHLIELCPSFLETNCICRAQGTCCLFFCGEEEEDGDKEHSINVSSRSVRSTRSNGDDRGPQPDSCLRSFVMKFVMLFNICGLILTVFAALALARDTARSGLVVAASFASTNLQPQMVSQQPFQQQNDDQNIDFPTIYLDLGLNAMAIDNPNLEASGVDPVSLIAYKDFCTLYYDVNNLGPGIVGNDNERYGTEQFLKSKDNCNDCHESSLYTTIGILVAASTQLLTMKHNITRMYRSYDMNCVKCSTLLWSVIGLAGYALTVYFFSICWSSFNDDTVFYSRGALSATVTYIWTVGTGQLCFFVAFGLKIIESVCNCLLPTPLITRSIDEQWQYESLVEDFNDKGNNTAGEQNKTRQEDGSSEGDDEGIEVVSSSSDSTY